MNDVGPVTITGINLPNTVIEAMDIIAPSGVYDGTLYFDTFVSTTPGSIGQVTTDIVGSSTNHGVNVSVIYDSSGVGIPVMSANAFVGENFVLPSVETSTITAVGLVQSFGPNQAIRNVNTSTLSGVLNISFNFGQGVGITSLSYNGQTALLTAFSIDAVNSLSIRRSTLSIKPQSVTADNGQTMSVFKSLFK